MDWMNDADWNAEARFEGAPHGVTLEAHLRGYADSVRIEEVPGPQGNELLVLFRAEAGHTGAALRVRDILAATLKYHPALWQEVQAAQAENSESSADNDDGEGR